MRKSKQFWLIFLALFYTSFAWGQGKTIITNFNDAGYTVANNSFTSGGIDFYLNSWYNDSLSYVNQDSSFVYANQGDFSINLYDHPNNWIQVVFKTNDILHVDVHGDSPSDTSTFTFTKIGVKDTLFFNAGIHPFNFLNFNGSEFYVYEVTLNYSLDFSLNKDSICPGEKVIADYSDSNAYSVEWLAGDSTPSQKDFHFEHNYINPGVYNLSCIVHNYNETVDTIIRKINVVTDLVPSPQFWAKIDVGSACPGDPVEFGVEGNYNSYSWNFGDGSPIDSIDRPAHAFMYDTIYTVILTVTNACGNQGSDSIPVSIDSITPASANFFIGNSDVCPREEVYFEATNSGSFIWDFDDGQKAYKSMLNHAFPDTGSYLVTLINKNSCGFSDTSSQVINIMYHPERTGNVSVEAGFKDENNQNSGYIEVCPGSPVAFANYTQIEPGEIMYWDFGDSTPISKEFEPVHVYQNLGYHNPRLVVENNCGAINEFYLSINVIDTLTPNVMLQATPLEICPGESVFFWDDNFNPTQNYVYDFVFGDGDSLSNVTKLTSSEPKVLAVHNYNNEGDYQYHFTATNACGNSVSYMDTISVSSDSTKVPFYYVRNTSEQDEHGDMENWGKKFAETDAILKVPIHWAGWDSTKNDNFFVAVWYGSIDFMQPDLPQPNGFAKVKGNDSIATVYVPVQNGLSSVGVAAFWNCSGSIEGSPSIKGVPIDSLSMPIQSFPVNAGKTTNIPTINLEAWDGKCFMDWGLAEGDWTSDDLGGFQYVLHLGEDQYELEKRDSTGNVQFLERGYYDLWDSLFTFSPDYDEQMNTCFEPGSYVVDALNGILTFSLDTLANDLCTSRKAIFANKFHKMPSMYDKEGVCPKDPVLFQALGGTSYEWVFNNTDTLRGSIVDYSFSTVGDYQVNLLASNACGRLDSLYSYVHVADDIFADNGFNMDKNTAFAGEQVQFHYGRMDDPVAQNYTYFWNFGDGTTASGSNPTHIFLNKGKYDVTLSVKNGCGESPASHQQITISDKPNCKAQFDWNPLGIDSLAFVNLSLGDSANTVYLWNFGDGTQSNEFEPIHYFNAAGVYDVSLTTRDTVFDCVNTETRKVQIGVVDCYADFDFFINNQSNEVSFNDKSQGNLSSWHWDFGDGNYSDIKEPIHTFAPGLYTVSLTVFNVETGCQSTNFHDITVGQLDCHPEFSSYVDSLTVEFHDESVGATGFYWDFGDGETDSVPNPIHSYAQTGIYTVYYSIWNDSTSCEGDMTRDIEVSGKDSTLCSVSFNYFVDTLTANFELNSTTQFTDYYWEIGNEAYDSIANPSYTFNQGGVYTVCLYAYDNVTGCQANYCEDIPIQISSIDCKSDFSVRKGNSPGEFVFTDKSIGNPTDRSWDFGDNTFGSDTVEVHKYQEDGYYTVNYSIYDSLSDCFSETSKDIPVKLQDTATVSCKADFSYFINATDLKITLKDKSLGNVDTWYWTFGDGNYDASQNPVHTYGYPGEYTITLYVFNNTTGCTDQLAQTIYIGTKDCNLTADIGYLVDTAKIVKFTDQSTGEHQVSYWTFGDGNTADTTKVDHQYAAPGFYLVTLAVIDTVSGCNDHTSAFIQIGSSDCKADFEYTVNVDSLKVTYLNKSKNNSFNYWDFGNGHFSDEANPSFNYRVPGKHYNALVIGDSSGVCWDFIDKLVQVGEIKCDAEFEATVNPNTLVTEFNNKAQVQSTQLYWQFGDGSTSTIPSPKYRYSHPGYYLASLYTSNDVNDCYDYQEQLILVGNEGDDCEADFFYQANANTREVNFNDKSKGSDLTYFWNFGDGSTSTDQSPTHTFTDPGYQYVCLTVVNGNGISNLTCKDVQVGEGCLAQFNFKVDSLSVTFEDNSFGTPTNWHWEFGDSTKVDSQNPIHKYDKAGDYLVFLGVKNASGCVNRTVQIVSVGNAEDTTFTADFAYEVDTTSTKPTRPVEMYGTGKGDSPKPKWNFGDAQKRGYASNDGTLRPTYNYANTDTTYHVCLTIEDPITGKSATTCHDIKLGTGGSSSVKDLSSYVQMNIYPNPAKDFTKLNYSLTKNMDVKMTIYDVSGNRVKEVLNQKRIAGAYIQDINLSGITSGTYFIEIRSSLGKISKKFVIRK